MQSQHKKSVGWDLFRSTNLPRSTSSNPLKNSAQVWIQHKIKEHIILTRTEKGAVRLCVLAHRVGGNRKCNQQSTNADKKSIETRFRLPFVDKWQSKTLFLLVLIYVPR